MLKNQIVNMVKARKYVVKKYFEGLPKRSDFELVEYDLPPLQKGEIMLKTEWISVDPYVRAYNREFQLPFDQFGLQVGLVQESKDPNYPVGTRMVTHKGWCDYSIIKVDKPDKEKLVFSYKLPDLKGLSTSLGVGAVGLTGVTTYFGFLETCQPKPGETVVVTGAAGAVGSLVGQVAKIKGCKVIGFAGSEDKVKWLEDEMGFDKALNYKVNNIVEELKEAAPDGIDCYFDNVGGELSSIIINQMNRNGRVAVCGSMSTYNSDELPKATILQPAILFNRLQIRGFIMWDHLDRWHEAFEPLVGWIKNGKLKTPEHITEGFDNIYDAFIGILKGENKGKAVVKI